MEIRGEKMGKKIYLQSVIGYREDTLENWQKENPVLRQGEASVVRDGTEGKWLKIGDGKTEWNNLDYKMGPVGPKGPVGEKGEKGDRDEKGERGTDGKDAAVDTVYTPTSQNAQSGTAVAQAVDALMPNGLELIAEGELTEAVNSILINKDKDGNPLALTDLISLYLYSPANLKSHYTTIKINNRLVAQVPTMVAGAETHSKAFSVFNGYEWETFYVQAAPAGSAAVNVRGVTPFRTAANGKKTVSSIQLYCYAAADVMPIGFKYKLYGRRAK